MSFYLVTSSWMGAASALVGASPGSADLLRSVLVPMLTRRDAGARRRHLSVPIAIYRFAVVAGAFLAGTEGDSRAA
jgi:hypothetical protein